MRALISMAALATTMVVAGAAMAQQSASEDVVAPRAVAPSATSSLIWHMPPPGSAYEPQPLCVPLERRSLGLMVTGIVLLAASPMPLVIGAATFDDSHGESMIVAAPIFATVLTAGIVMTVVGKKFVPKPKNADVGWAAPQIGVGLGAASAAWRF